MMRLLLPILFLSGFAHAQVNTTTWGVDDTSVCIVKSTDFFMVHDYIAMENFSGAALQMVWVRRTDPAWPLPWEAGFTDPDSFYVDVLSEDTATFTLPYPVEFSNQLILDLDHNNHVDSSYLQFNVYPVDHPEDSLLLTFCVIIHLPDAGFSETSTEAFNILFDATQSYLQITGPVVPGTTCTLYHYTGEKVVEQNLTSALTLLHLQDVCPGMYIVHVHSPLGEQRQKIVIY